jgi:hypothetical protein
MKKTKAKKSYVTVSLNRQSDSLKEGLNLLFLRGC